MMIRRTLFALCIAVLWSGLALAEGRLIFLIGPPASGKSTQAAFLHKRFGLAVIAAEDLIKANPQAFNPRRATGVDHLEPHSDPVMNELVRDKLKTLDLSNGVIFDGYPATKDHADFLSKLIQDLGFARKTLIIQMEVPDEEVRKRLKDSKDPAYTPNIVEQRLKDYRREMEMIQLYYPEATIHKVDGTKKPNSVSKHIEQIIDKS